MDKLYANGFQNVRFSEVTGLKLSRNELPSGAFYAALYEEIERRGGGIPNEQVHLTSKRQTAQILSDEIRSHFGHLNGLRAFSWGAGLGVVEAELERIAKIRLDAVEVKKNARHWNPAVEYFPTLDSVPPDRRYDVVFTISTLYSLNDADARHLLDQMVSRLSPGGMLILFEQDSFSLFGALEGAVASTLYTPSRHYTLWGFLRTPAQLLALRPSKVQPVASRYFGFNDDGSYYKLARSPRLFGRQLTQRKSRMQLHTFSA